MRDLLGWDISLGRVAGVQVRLHFFFLLFAILAVHQATADDQRFATVALAGLGWLLLGTLAHEVAHVLSARRLGADVDQVVLWPLGGLSYPRFSGAPLGELAVAAAGIGVNLALAVGLAAALFATGRTEEIPLNPLAPPATSADLNWVEVVQLGVWTNWVLALVNLLPAAPLDGGRILRALLWPYLGLRGAVVRVAQWAKLSAILLCLAGWFLRDSFPFAWVPLALLGVFVYFSARQELERLQASWNDRRWPSPEISDPPLEFAASGSRPAADRDLPGRDTTGRGAAQAPRGDDRRGPRAERSGPADEAEEDRRVDAILARLHERGLAQLSAEERALLDRVSARYRQRQRR